MRLLILSAFLLAGYTAGAQVRKSVEALYIERPLAIDAVLDEQAYLEARPAVDFVQVQPYNGRPAMQPTEVYFFYDQRAVYVGAMLYDSAPDSIINNYTERDRWGIFDEFGVYLDPYNEGQLAFAFFVSPAGVQFDLKATRTNDGDDEDINWDAVWESKTRITDKGWVVEMRIPYSALRFPDREVHTWGLNMFRMIRRHNSNNSWNLVDRNISGFIDQEGELTGIKNIKPPVRLSLSPYAAAYTEFRSGESKPGYTWKGGMDLKYGLNDAFTLDMMLIPDFGQIQSDDKELNLSPYELYYDEKRQFFTESTELFQRADIFYSRRIGGVPKFSGSAESSLLAHEVVDYNPIETQLLNATKVSGRNSGGWGIGVLNAMTLPSRAVLKDTLSKQTREVITQPFTNYNVSVVDKSLKNSSYVSLINTNMVMANNPFMANVTATEFELRNKSKTYALSGSAGVTVRGDSAREQGFGGSIGIAKNSGKLRFGILQSMLSDQCDFNDLGYLRRNNEIRTEFDLGYHIIEPFWIVRETHLNAWWNYARIHKPSDRYGHEVALSWYTLFKNHYEVEISTGMESNRHDYYEPRVTGRFYDNAWYGFTNVYVSTNQSKPVGAYGYAGAYIKPDFEQHGNSAGGGLVVRIGQRVQTRYDFDYNYEYNEPGFVSKSDNDDTVHFAKREATTLQHVLTFAYAITNKAGISLRMRHYWSGADAMQYFLLQEDGSLLADEAYSDNNDLNYNAFNIDMVFRWVFAPGSELSLAWKNAIYNEEDIVVSDYFRNLGETIRADQTNSISLKVLYYLDYNQLRRNK